MASRTSCPNPPMASGIRSFSTANVSGKNHEVIPYSFPEHDESKPRLQPLRGTPTDEETTQEKENFIVVAAPVPAGPPSKPPELPVTPTASKPPAVSLTTLIELVLIAACVVGFVTVAVWIDALVHPPPPPPGWLC
jgi:hypothetical protein